MSSTITPSEDKLYLTEDLEGRLDPADLEAPKDVEKPSEESDFYKSNPSYSVLEPELPPLIEASVGICYENAETLVLDGNLLSLSFGHDGWLCSVSVADNLVTPVALKAAELQISYVDVILPQGRYRMQTNIDCTVTFSYGSATLTVTSDEACYV